MRVYSVPGTVQGNLCILYLIFKLTFKDKFYCFHFIGKETKAQGKSAEFLDLFKIFNETDVKPMIISQFSSTDFKCPSTITIVGWKL